MNNLPESFSEAKQNLINNLTNIVKDMKYTPTLLAIQLSAVSDTPVLSTDISMWLDGNKLPSVYQLFKLSNLFEIPMDLLFSTDFRVSAINNPTIYSIGTEQLLLANINQTKENLMATKNTTVAISKTSKKRMEEVVKAHTTSTNYNIMLANKIYSSDMTLKTIAEHAGISTRSMRDYAFYGTTVPTDVAYRLVKLFKTTYRNLGLAYDATTERYIHRSVTVKA